MSCYLRVRLGLRLGLGYRITVRVRIRANPSLNPNPNPNPNFKAVFHQTNFVSRSDFFFCLMGFRLELMMNLLNLNNEKSICATKFAKWKIGYRWENMVSYNYNTSANSSQALTVGIRHLEVSVKKNMPFPVDWSRNLFVFDLGNDSGVAELCKK